MPNVHEDNIDRCRLTHELVRGISSLPGSSGSGPTLHGSYLEAEYRELQTDLRAEQRHGLTQTIPYPNRTLTRASNRELSLGSAPIRV